MNVDNEACVQRAIFRFYYKKPCGSDRATRHSFLKNATATKIGPESVRALKEHLTARLERIAQMMEILLNAHSDWALTERQDHFQMETLSFDFNQAVQMLRSQGFSNEEYALEVEYTRKWGVL